MSQKLYQFMPSSEHKYPVFIQFDEDDYGPEIGQMLNATHLFEVEAKDFTELMKQKQYSPQSIAEMGLLIFAADNGYLNDVSVEKIGDLEDALLSYAHAEHGDLMKGIAQNGNWDSDSEAAFKSLLDAFKSTQTW